MFDSIESLLPHRPPMRFIHRLTDDGIGCACFSENDFAVVNGRVLESALIECAAQTMAAQFRRQAQKSGEAKTGQHGMLLAVTNFKFTGAVQVGDAIEIELREVKALGLMRLIAATIKGNGQCVATGELTVYV